MKPHRLFFTAATSGLVLAVLPLAAASPAQAQPGL
jgi:hypothetical protein